MPNQSIHHNLSTLSQPHNIILHSHIIHTYLLPINKFKFPSPQPNPINPNQSTLLQYLYNNHYKPFNINSILNLRVLLFSWLYWSIAVFILLNLIKGFEMMKNRMSPTLSFTLRTVKVLTKEKIIELLLLVVNGKRSIVIFDTANSRNAIKVCNKAKTSFVTKYHRNGSLTVTLRKDS